MLPVPKQVGFFCRVTSPVPRGRQSQVEGRIGSVGAMNLHIRPVG